MQPALHAEKGMWMLNRAGWKFAVACVVLAVAACSKSDPEQALRAQFAGLQSAIEAKDASALQQFLADDFIGNDGMDRRQARAMATMLMTRYQSLGVTIGPLDVKMQPPANAQVAFTAMMTGGTGNPLPERIQAYQVETAWREVGGEWVMYHAKWTPRL